MEDPVHVAASFDERAATYGRNAWHQRYAEQLVGHASLRTGQHVLDAGVGTGFAAVAIAQAVGRDGRVVGVDLSRGMLDQARATLDVAGLHWVELLQRDATDLHDIRDGTFDAVICAAALLYMPVDAALVEWRRLLRPGGLVAFSTMQRGSPRAGALFRECARAFGVLLDDPSEALGSADACQSALERAGFVEIRVVPGDVELAAADLSLAWAANMRSAGHAAVRSLAPADLEHLRQRFEEALADAHANLAQPAERAAVLYAIGRR